MKHMPRIKRKEKGTECIGVLNSAFLQKSTSHLNQAIKEYQVGWSAMPRKVTGCCFYIIIW